ncbi:MAG: hypothetical protein IPL33_11475 [Sphingobacteriales bacterium]|nr:hypothetical protein [Sphingobacteriales bacterium]
MMKHFLTFLFAAVCWVCSNTAQAQTTNTPPSSPDARQWDEVMRDFKHQSQSSLDSVRYALEQGMAELQKGLDQLQVTPDGKIIAGQQTIDTAPQLEKLAAGIEAIGKVFDVPAEDLQPVRSAVAAMLLLLQQGIELLKTLEPSTWGNTTK